MNGYVIVTIPGWFWLLPVAVAAGIGAWRMVRVIGMRKLLLSGYTLVSPAEVARMMIFFILLMTPFVCIWVIFKPLVT